MRVFLGMLSSLVILLFPLSPFSPLLSSLHSPSQCYFSGSLSQLTSTAKERCLNGFRFVTLLLFTHHPLSLLSPLPLPSPLHSLTNITLFPPFLPPFVSPPSDAVQHARFNYSTMEAQQNHPHSHPHLPTPLLLLLLPSTTNRHTYVINYEFFLLELSQQRVWIFPGVCSSTRGRHVLGSHKVLLISSALSSSSLSLPLPLPLSLSSLPLFLSSASLSPSPFLSPSNYFTEAEKLEFRIVSRELMPMRA